jgi:hypothetical protein
MATKFLAKGLLRSFLHQNSIISSVLRSVLHRYWND